MATDKDRKPRLRGLGHRRPIMFPGLVAGTAIAATLTLSGLSAGPQPAEVSLPSVADAPVASLPIEVNERVRYWLERFTADQRPTMELFLAREEVFGSIIRDKLRARGMPAELLYLAGIESGFRSRAISVDSATGVWQFMGPTAEQYGLRVDAYVDERRDPIRATDAALDYLQYLHERYDSWYLAAAAYNAGPSRVDRALRGAGPSAGDLDVFWDIQHHLPLETREYVPKVIAATMLARDAEEYGFGDVERELPFAFDRVWVPGGTSLWRVAEATASEMSALRTLNPHLLQAVVPPGGSYELRVPVGSTHQVVASIGGGPWGSRATDD